MIVSDLLCPVLVGRSRDVERLRVRLEAAREGRGGLVSPLGEAGVGKSRLLREQRLFLSPRTVERHVADLLTKTDSSNRRELAGCFAELGARVHGQASDDEPGGW